MYSPLNRLKLDMDMENLFNTQEYYAGQGSGHDYYAGQGSGSNKKIYTGQNCSMGQGSANGSAHDLAPVEDDFPVEEVARPSKLRRNKSGSCDLTVYQKACVEYAAEYDHDFFIRAVLAKFEESFCSAKGGLNLNEEADGYEVRDVQPMGRDRAKKKSSSSSRFEASSAVGGGIVDVVADKWKSLKSVS
ncbi:hypothetical protein Tco_0789615 [Tanacetum coccineum]